MSDDSDPYLYPGTDVLKNVPGLRASEQLAAFETFNTGARIYEDAGGTQQASSLPRGERPNPETIPGRVNATGWVRTAFRRR
jgi:hypothetical protein